MKNQNTQQEEVRCINKKTGKVKFFRRWFAFDKNWQRNTGFSPEELPKVASIESQPVINPPVDMPQMDFDESLITTEVDETVSEIKETPSAKPKGKKADKTTHK